MDLGDLDDQNTVIQALLVAQQEGNVAKVDELRQVRTSCLRVELMVSELLSEVRAWRSLPLGGDH